MMIMMIVVAASLYPLWHTSHCIIHLYIIRAMVAETTTTPPSTPRTISLTLPATVMYNKIHFVKHKTHSKMKTLKLSNRTKHTVRWKHQTVKQNQTLERFKRKLFIRTKHNMRNTTGQNTTYASSHSCFILLLNWTFYLFIFIFCVVWSK